MKKVALMGLYGLIGLGCCLTSAGLARGADKPPKPDKEAKHPAIAPGEALEEGWEELDPRQQFLFKRLAKVEALLDALEDMQFSNYGTQRRKAAESAAADRSIVRQYANGGGPVRWTQFYGRTVDEFYHSGPSRAAAILDGRGNAGVAISQGSPALKQRPPQFDYIEKAQQKIKADAANDVKSLAKKYDQIDARRKELEVEQITLWCQIAFREIQRRDLTQKPFYRFEPVSLVPESDAPKQVEAMRVAVILMSRVLRIVEKSEEDQARALQRIAATVKGVRVRMTDTWIRQGVLSVSVSNDRPDIATPKGRFIALTRHLENYGANVDESCARAIVDSKSRAELSKLDEKKQSWDQLTKSLTGFAAVVLAMDETAIELAKEWQVQPDLSMALVLEEESTPSLDPSIVASDKLSSLREIRFQKNGKWVPYAVSHEGGVAYLARNDGSKVPLALDGQIISWQNPNGNRPEVSIDDPATSGAKLVYDDAQPSSPQKAKGKGKQSGKGKR